MGNKNYRAANIQTRMYCKNNRPFAGLGHMPGYRLGRP